MNATEKLNEAAANPQALRMAIADSEIVPLLMSLVHMTGNPKYLREARPYIRGAWDYMQTIPKALQVRIRDELEKELLTAAAEGRVLPDLPPDELVQEMVNTAVGQELSSEYAGVLRDEANFGFGDNRRVTWRAEVPKAALRNFLVVVIGSGFSGVCAGIKLKEAGIPFVIIEKNQDVAGTWLENVYPGIGVDTPCHLYSYSFEPNPDWSSYFVDGEEIRQYIAHCVDKYGIREHIRFGEEVTDAIYNPKRAIWTVSTKRAGGQTTTIDANAVISCVGALNRPMIPRFPGLENFKGRAFHTAAWDRSVDFRGKRVVMIGNGASGIQVAPSIAPIVDKLTIIQRSPPWIIRHPLYHQHVPMAVRWSMRNLPHYSNWYRFLQYYAASDGFHSTLFMDPDWEQSSVSLNAANHRMREDLIRHIKDELGDRSDLIEKVIPDYPPYGKRMLRDNNWYVTLKRPNVKLVADGVERVEPNAVISGGESHPADIIVFATGFHAGRMLWPMNIQGKSGVSLRDLWGEEDPRAHLGTTFPDFPNFFICYGPNTNPAHGGSVVFHSECQVRYIMLALREIIERGAATIEVRREPFEEYNRQVDARLSRMSWAHPRVTSWHKNKSGRVVMNSPWRLVEYRNMTAELDVENYAFDYQASTACPELKVRA
jgi:4-hydroxyacetophenone monooxygenase